MKTLVFDYRTSTTGSWQSQPLTASALSCRVYLMPNAEKENSQVRRSGGKTCENLTPRMMVDVVLSVRNFDDDIQGSTNGTSAWLYVQKWCCAKQRRLIFKPSGTYETTVGLDGFHEFDSASNENYLNLNDVNITFEDYDSEDRRIRYIVINLESQQSYNVT